LTTAAEATSTTAGAGSSKHVPELDGVRGLAILFVLVFHARAVYANFSEIPLPIFRVLDLGWSGVDLFFVLSGFLITGILLDSRESKTYFRTFYIRRALRIFPLYFAYVLLVMVAVRPIYRWFAHEDPWSATNPWWYVTYLLNWKADHGFDDLYLGHLWSLAIEEQFYFVWPLIVWLCPKKKLVWLCGSVALASLALRFYMYSRGVWPEAIYRLTPTRMDALALGSLAAIGIRNFRTLCERLIVPAAALSGFGVLILVSRARATYWGDMWVGSLGTFFLAVLYTALVFAAATQHSSGLSTFLRYEPLRKVGKYSYAMYVLHSIPYNLSVDWTRNWLNGKNAEFVVISKALYFPALIGMAFLAGWLSWNLLEKRVLRFKQGFRYG